MLNASQREMVRTWGTLAGRIFIAALFLFSGVGIILQGMGETAVGWAAMGVPVAGLAVWIVVAVKLIGGAALALGYRTGLAAAALLAFTAGTILIAHLDIQTDINFWKNMAIIGGLLYIVAYGPGEGWSLDTTSDNSNDVAAPVGGMNNQIV